MFDLLTARTPCPSMLTNHGEKDALSTQPDSLDCSIVYRSRTTGASNLLVCIQTNSPDDTMFENEENRLMTCVRHFAGSEESRFGFQNRMIAESSVGRLAKRSTSMNGAKSYSRATAPSKCVASLEDRNSDSSWDID